MPRRLALRRFPHEVIRRRQAPGAFNEYGEYVEGGTITAVLPASIQPILLSDINAAAGVSLLARLAVFVPVGIERVVAAGENAGLEWAGEELTWNGEPLTWGGFSAAISFRTSLPCRRRSTTGAPIRSSLPAGSSLSRSPNCGATRTVAQSY